MHDHKNCHRYKNEQIVQELIINDEQNNFTRYQNVFLKYTDCKEGQKLNQDMEKICVILSNFSKSIEGSFI